MAPLLQKLILVWAVWSPWRCRAPHIGTVTVQEIRPTEIRRTCSSLTAQSEELPHTKQYFPILCLHALGILFCSESSSFPWLIILSNTKQQLNETEENTVDNYIKHATFKYTIFFSKDPNQNKQLFACWSYCWSSVFKSWLSGHILLVTFTVCKFSSGWHTPVHLVWQFILLVKLWKEDTAAVMWCLALSLCRRWSRKGIGKSTSSHSTESVKTRKQISMLPKWTGI